MSQLPPLSNPSLLTLAMTHRSLSATENNQRLEFLGDRVLGLVVAEMLYDAFPEEQEGDLAKRHAALVCGETLVRVARALALGDHLLLAQGEELGGGRDNTSNLEDACEALIGALFLDGGLDAARRFIHAHWTTLLESVNEPPKDAKTALQEWAQARGMPLPAYRETARSGPDHAPEFTIEVRLENGATASATANSKKAAEQEAARAMLLMLHG